MNVGRRFAVRILYTGGWLVVAVLAYFVFHTEEPEVGHLVAYLAGKPPPSRLSVVAVQRTETAHYAGGDEVLRTRI